MFWISVGDKTRDQIPNWETEPGKYLSFRSLSLPILPVTYCGIQISGTRRGGPDGELGLTVMSCVIGPLHTFNQIRYTISFCQPVVSKNS